MSGYKIHIKRTIAFISANYKQLEDMMVNNPVIITATTSKVSKNNLKKCVRPS